MCFKKYVFRSETNLNRSISIEHKRILQKKIFLRKWYQNCYQQFLSFLPPSKHSLILVELGSGGGFLKEMSPSIITTDIQNLNGIDLNCSALQLPFKTRSIDAFFALNAFHHFPDAKLFLQEINRCLKPGGQLILIEPANTFFARFVYRHFHHEPFDPKGEWSFKSHDPLMDANGALPWIVFTRDRNKFRIDFPQLEITSMKAHSFIIYLLSGGFSYKSFMPAWSFSFWNKLEQLISSLGHFLGMFYTIRIKKATDRS